MLTGAPVESINEFAPVRATLPNLKLRQGLRLPATGFNATHRPLEGVGTARTICTPVTAAVSRTTFEGLLGFHRATLTFRTAGHGPACPVRGRP